MMTPMTKKFWDNLTPFVSKSYLDGFPLSRLAAVAIYTLSNSGIESSFNNIAIALFRMFPEKFKLVSFPEHPDFVRIDNTLRLDCSHSNLAVGNRVKGFKLTEHGNMVAEETLQLLKNNRKPGNIEERTESGRNRVTKLVNEVMESTSYQKFSSGRVSHIQKFEVVDLLHGTLDTDSKKLKANLNILIKYAQDLKDFEKYRNEASSVNDFLSHIKKNWGVLIGE
jgi:hypothetical protein